MTDTVSLILAVVGALLTWTATVATLTFWLASKFREIEKLIYQERELLDAKYETIIKDYGNRIMVLELKRFGHTGTIEPASG